MAGALSDDAPTGTTVVNETKDVVMSESGHTEKVVEQPLPNQKVGIVKALLSLGDLEHALLILSRYPRLTASYPELADLLCRLIHVMIEDVYAPFSPSTHHSQLSRSKDFAYRYPPPSKTEVSIVRTLTPNLPLATSSQRFEYFYADWKQDLVRCQTALDIIEFVKPILTLVGVRIHRDTVLVAKLCRIGAATLFRLRGEIKPLTARVAPMEDGPEKTVVAAQLQALELEHAAVELTWTDMTRSLFLPTISLVYSNPGTTISSSTSKCRYIR
jgi:THO complex subunit 2